MPENPGLLTILGAKPRKTRFSGNLIHKFGVEPNARPEFITPSDKAFAYNESREAAKSQLIPFLLHTYSFINFTNLFLNTQKSPINYSIIASVGD